MWVDEHGMTHEGPHPASHYEKRIRELEAERDRLREALQHIAALESDFMSDPIGNAGVDHDKARIARAALDGEEES